MQRYTAREIWQMEDCQSPRTGCNVVLGVDGSASNTVCVCIPADMPFADPLPVLSRAIAGCSNQNSVGEDRARETLERVMAQALLKARRRRSNVSAVCLAVAGVNHPIDQHRMLHWLGWTYEDQSWARIADILPVVVESAEAGDEVANKILHNSVGELASSVKAVVQRLALSGEDGKDLFPLVLVGKVLEANKKWDIGKEVIDCVTKTYPGAYPIHPEVEPAVGAALLAWNAIASELDGDLRTAV